VGRLPTAYRPDPQTGELSVLDDPADSWWSRPPSFPDASGWLVSTIDDYWSFVSMILAGGTGRGERILTPAAGASASRCPAAAAQTNRFHAASAGMAAPARHGARTPAAASPESSSANDRPPRRLLPG